MSFEKKDFIVIHGHVIADGVDADGKRESGHAYHKGEVLKLSIKDSAALIKAGAVKPYEPAKDGPQKAHVGKQPLDKDGNPIMSRAEFEAAGYEPETYDEYVAFAKSNSQHAEAVKSEPVKDDVLGTPPKPHKKS